MTEETELSENVLAAIKAGRKIDAIKILREERNLGLKEAKHVVDKHIGENSHLSIDRSRPGNISLTPLLLAALITGVLYFAYKALP
jgi:hypothetical protein